MWNVEIQKKKLKKHNFNKLKINKTNKLKLRYIFFDIPPTQDIIYEIQVFVYI